MLGDTIRDWLQEVADWLYEHNLMWRSWDTLLHDLLGFFEGKPPDATKLLIDELSALPIPTTMILAQVLAGITGKPIPIAGLQTVSEFQRLTSDPKAYMLQVAKSLGESPQLAEVQQILGRILVDIVITPLENTLDDGIEDPKKFTAQFHGALAALTLSGHVLSLAAEVTGLGQIETVGRAVSDLYFNFGLGFMGWQTISPLLDIGIKEAGGRYYNRRYHPARFTFAQLMELYSLQERTYAQTISELDNLGWRNEDKDTLIRLSRQRESSGDILRAFTLDVIREDEAITRLTQRGYSPETARFIVRLEMEDRAQSQREAIISVARTAFKKALLSESQFRATLAAAHFAQDRIDLEVAIGRLSSDTENRDLSVAQIKSAFSENVLREGDLRGYLLKVGVDSDAIPILIETWKRELAPAQLRLNSNTLSAAYQENVISRSELMSRLDELGWSPGDAEIIAKIADQKIAERRAKEALAAVKRISISDLESAFKAGVITAGVASATLKEIGLPDGDIAILLSTWQTEMAVRPVELSADIIRQAFRRGVIDEAETRRRLASLGLSDADIEVVIELVFTQIIEDAERERAAGARAVSVGMVRSAYVAKVIDRSRAEELLTQIETPPETTALLLSTWDAVMVETPVRLGAGIISTAYVSGLITRSQALSKLGEIGVTGDDAETIVKIAERRFGELYPHPTGEAIIDAYINNIIPLDQAVTQLKAKGYSDSEARLLLRSRVVSPTLKVKPISESAVIKLVKLGFFDESEAIRRLKLLGYDDEGAELVLVAALTSLPKITEE